MDQHGRGSDRAGTDGEVRLSLVGAGTLFGLFTLQVIWPETRGLATVAYGMLTAVALFLSRRHLRNAFRWVSG